MTLPDDPREALKTIADYLDAVRADEARAVEEKDDNGDPNGVVEGYWQTVDYTQGLVELAAEARRVSAL